MCCSGPCVGALVYRPTAPPLLCTHLSRIDHTEACPTPPCVAWAYAFEGCCRCQYWIRGQRAGGCILTSLRNQSDKKNGPPRSKIPVMWRWTLWRSFFFFFYGGLLYTRARSRHDEPSRADAPLYGKQEPLALTQENRGAITNIQSVSILPPLFTRYVLYSQLSDLSMMVFRQPQRGEIADGLHVVDKQYWPACKRRAAFESSSVGAFAITSTAFDGNSSGDGRDPSFYDRNDSTGPTFDGPPALRGGGGEVISMAIFGARDSMAEACEALFRKQAPEMVCVKVGTDAPNLASIGFSPAKAPNTKVLPLQCAIDPQVSGIGRGFFWGRSSDQISLLNLTNFRALRSPFVCICAGRVELSWSTYWRTACTRV